jgi:hypothetical protein
MEQQAKGSAAGGGTRDKYAICLAYRAYGVRGTTANDHWSFALSYRDSRLTLGMAPMAAHWSWRWWRIPDAGTFSAHSQH